MVSNLLVFAGGLFGPGMIVLKGLQLLELLHIITTSNSRTVKQHYDGTVIDRPSTKVVGGKIVQVFLNLTKVQI